MRIFIALLFMCLFCFHFNLVTAIIMIQFLTSISFLCLLFVRGWDLFKARWLLEETQYFFFAFWLPSFSFVHSFDIVSWKIYKNISTYTFANLFDWVCWSGGTDIPGELCYNSFIWNSATRMALLESFWWDLAKEHGTIELTVQ